jgi:hypothetical protein
MSVRTSRKTRRNSASLNSRRFFGCSMRQTEGGSMHSKLEGYSCFNNTFVSKRAEEMIQKRLRLALFVSTQCLREANEFVQRGFQLMSHGSMLTKSALADKPRSARLLRPRSGQAQVERYHNIALLGDAEVGREWSVRCRAGRSISRIVCADFGWWRLDCLCTFRLERFV